MSSAQRSSPFRAFSIASGNSDRNRSCVIDAEPRHNVDRRLIIVDTEAHDFGSGVGNVTATVLDGGGIFEFPALVVVDVAGPAAFDSLKEKI